MIFAQAVRPIEKAETARDRTEFPEWEGPLAARSEHSTVFNGASTLRRGSLHFPGNLRRISLKRQILREAN
jgi:hypothetical protein